VDADSLILVKIKCSKIFPAGGRRLPDTCKNKIESNLSSWWHRLPDTCKNKNVSNLSTWWTLTTPIIPNCKSPKAAPEIELNCTSPKVVLCALAALNNERSVRNQPVLSSSCSAQLFWTAFTEVSRSPRLLTKHYLCALAALRQQQVEGPPQHKSLYVKYIIHQFCLPAVQCNCFGQHSHKYQEVHVCCPRHVCVH
jgi:hypothetical protein